MSDTFSYPIRFVPAFPAKEEERYLWQQSCAETDAYHNI